MSECECLPGCAFFHDKMENMPGMSGILKSRYCIGDNSECARHVVFEKLGKAEVPADLYPNQLDAALKLLAARGVA
jgi:hypothetical protein